MRTGGTFYRNLISKVCSRVRQSIVVLAVSLISGACGGGGPPAGQVGFVTSGFGGVVSDEPKSALIGRDILSSGGNAVDAAVATYFALSVTYPGAASLGGGGMCMIFGGRQDVVEAIDFRAQLFEKDGKTIMVPGAVRGMFALHARYGKLKWESLILPAEQLARFGNPISRAFARRLVAVPLRLLTDPAIRRLFVSSGKIVGEGYNLKQFELSSSLSRIRLRGPGDFYSGEFAKQLAQGLGAAAGTDIPLSVLREYRPRWLKTQKFNLGRDELHLPANRWGDLAAAIWRGSGSMIDRDYQADQESAGFITVDREGGGTACVVSTNGIFGAGSMIGPSGILMAAPLASGSFSGVPMLFLNRALKDTRGAISGSGGRDGAERAMSTARRIFDARVLPKTLFGPIKDTNGRANVIYCPEGARENTDSCIFSADPAGHGLAVSATL
ncbi:MAG: Gamma-glutamyltranspeptidase [Alphaproteobacteria bacterium MarineAlpha11_Bin1]|nr:MAG: Gamma-glutamyltranspeptidase [Alphaproteobacteria bacterium MarineAlpha11_Bin1]